MSNHFIRVLFHRFLVLCLFVTYGCSQPSSPLDPRKKSTPTVDEQIASATECINRDSNDFDAYLKRGRAYKSKRAWAKAIADLTKAIEINPREHLAYFYRGRTYHMTNEHELALADFNKTICIEARHFIKSKISTRRSKTIAKLFS